ncbi:hypothetical protein A1507_15545 [Methylomonas koyamae]|uniref:Uncharacterized protein n=1 Tax=Methylomonas koyamae TaxID=702114 RepID=A0A177N8J2_9GAMM|nr:hypothetical protein [Methylomonas koyamae]OAI14215.1 hypothetical protein A1507_15545 [Methylomonas koyamae]
MNFETARFVADSIDDLEHKIAVVARACYPEYDRPLITESMETVLSDNKASPTWDKYITNKQELFLLLAFHNLLLAEAAFKDKNLSGALIYVAEGNFEIGCFYGSHDIIRENKRAAGKKPKPDTLQILINQIVRNNPEISEKELLSKLEKEKGLGVIEDVEDIDIVFSDKNDQLKAARVSGLKDRLSRAKKKFALTS